MKIKKIIIIGAGRGGIDTVLLLLSIVYEFTKYEKKLYVGGRI